MILVDSSVWIDFFNGKKTRFTDFLDELLGSDFLLTGDLILAEVMQGFRSNQDAKIALDLLSGIEYADMMGKAVAIESAKNYRHLRAKGITPRKPVDIWIGTFCILNNLTLLHDDRDFAPLHRHLGLKVIPS